MPDLIDISRRLAGAFDDATFDDPVTHVYNPLEYAWEPHREYLERFGEASPREILLVGMNPGPWGMGQTGVPFGDVDFVTDWMGIDGEVGKPDDEHPKKEVEGLDCGRNEVSGSRLWSWAEERYGAAEEFFERYYVHNYCPLLFLQESGRNHAPSRMLKAERQKLTPACDEALREVVEYLEPEFVVGVGNFARDRINSIWDEDEVDFTIGRVLHPSPASPQANQGWVSQAEEQLQELGVEV